MRLFFNVFLLLSNLFFYSLYSTTCVIVDVVRVAEEVDEFKQLRIMIEKDVDSRVKILDSLKNQIEEKLNKLRSGSKEMTSSALEKLQEDVGKLQGEFEIKKRNLDTFIQQSVQAAEASLAEEVRQEVKKIAEQEKWDIVLSGGILYANSDTDKTSVVVKALNVKSEAKKKQSLSVSKSSNNTSAVKK